jgi:hypothetical protein
MARSSTSFRPKWKLGNTTVIRVPQTLAPEVLRYAHDLDAKAAKTKRRMNKNDKMAELKTLQTKADLIRQEIGISPPGKVMFLANHPATGGPVVVEADGFGGATVSIVEGNYPIDYITKFEKSFASEGDAEEAAEAVAFQGAAPDRILATA